VNEPVLRCWGKTVTSSAVFHPAFYHMLDAGNVARQFLGADASSRWRAVLVRALNTSDDELAKWLPYIVALHDIGKISAGFQMENDVQAARLRREGFSLAGKRLPHQTVSEVYASMAFAPPAGQVSRWAKAVQQSLGGHHGRFIHPDDLRDACQALTGEPAEWAKLRQATDAALREALLDGGVNDHTDPANLSVAIMAITGFAILCDWLSSDRRFFDPEKNAGWPEYQKQSMDRARDAAEQSGFLTPALSPVPTGVASLFHDLPGIRPLQAAIDQIPGSLLAASSLTIIEAPTGEGKTEAALALAHRIATISGTDELYYALPTMATSNQMFGRLSTHIQTRLGLSGSIKLVHGQAFLVEDELRKETPLALVEPLRGGPHDEAVAVGEWFNSKKRALLAPFGVGTVDQAELAVLNVRHVPLRMIGLAGKVVIIDEVHAYDTYMTTIIKQLLIWCAALGTSVILLSATLPIARRKELVEAYYPAVDWSLLREEAYPSLLLVGGRGSHQAVPEVWQPDRTIRLHDLHFGEDEAKEKAGWLVNAVANGGCACWITNTVPRAQDIFRQLKQLSPGGIDLMLLHSQFPLDARQKLEGDLTRKYGPGGGRARPGIVVGTQVLEQSLDLDFDVMVSDLVPVDLLLQRSGRLHRHTRERPPAHAEARLYVNWQSTPDGRLKPGTDLKVYAEFTMRQTLRMLAGRTVISLPRDYRALVEGVYGATEPPPGDPDCEAWAGLKAEEDVADGEAKMRLLPGPSAGSSFARLAAVSMKFEEDENRSDWVVAQTRLAGESLEIIPLERDGNLAWVAGESARFSVRRELPADTQRRLLMHGLRISRPQAIRAIMQDSERQPVPAFTNSRLLRHHFPLWLKNGRVEMALAGKRVFFAMDPHLGLVIRNMKEGEQSDET
jgi:CRISPR-associated endonuclease/helicase Cas3